MIYPLRQRRAQCFLALLLVAVFLCVSLRHSSHVHHQHGSAEAELTFRHMSFVTGLSGRHGGEAEHHGEHSHDAPDKAAHLYKHPSGGKTLRVKADGDSKLKTPALICARDIALPTSEAYIQTPYVVGDSGAWVDGRPPARAPPAISEVA